MTKRDFGSFHSSNVQELINLTEEVYQPPSFPFGLPNFDQLKQDPPNFGKKVKKKLFFLEDDCTFINHGAFGAVLRDALSVAQKWQRYTEEQPLRFYDRELLPHLVYVTRRLAKFVGCDPTDLVLMTNATTAINSVIRTMKFTSEDRIFYLSVTYGAVKKLLKAISQETGVQLQEELVHFPVTGKHQIIGLVEKKLLENTKLALFDHVPSNAPFILPLEEIIRICHDRGVPVLVDGAHTLGVLPLDLRILQPDYYVSNAHKWFCCPKGSAFMYVKKEWQTTTRPLIVSHGYGSGFNSEFIWAGLHDYSPFLALHTVIDFWESRGPDIIRNYICRLVRDAANLLLTAWNTRLGAPLEMFGSMALIQLPESLYSHYDPVDYVLAEQIQNRLYFEYNIEVPIKSIQGHLYVRISAHIYNELEDYSKLADAVKDLA